MNAHAFTNLPKAANSATAPLAPMVCDVPTLPPEQADALDVAQREIAQRKLDEYYDTLFSRPHAGSPSIGQKVPTEDDIPQGPAFWLILGLGAALAVWFAALSLISPIV